MKYIIVMNVVVHWRKQFGRDTTDAALVANCRDWTSQHITFAYNWCRHSRLCVLDGYPLRGNHQCVSDLYEV